jgi:hypothetical protein
MIGTGFIFFILFICGNFIEKRKLIKHCIFFEEEKNKSKAKKTFHFFLDIKLFLFLIFFNHIERQILNDLLP